MAENTPFNQEPPGHFRKDFLNFAQPLIEEEEIEEVVASLKDGWLVTGPKVAKFQRMFKEYIGAAHAVALNSCTAGLHLSLLVAGVEAGDEVITVPFTFAATANTVIHAGARPVFVDIDRVSLTIDPERIEAAITPSTKAIIPVHFAGRPCDMDAVCDIARQHGLVVIEDAAHAVEAAYKGRKVGNIGDLAAFSFYATKNLCTGEGGMVTTNNPEWAEKIQVLSLHGLSRGAWDRYSNRESTQYEVVFPGFKYNMMDMQAALGIHQLPRLARYLKRREDIWRRYDEAFASLPLTLPAPCDPDIKHGRHLYTVLVDEERGGISRDSLREAMFAQNIGTAIHFVALHLQPYYAHTFGYQPGDFPNSEYISNRILSLPLSAKLTDEDVEDVIRAVCRSLDVTRGGVVPTKKELVD